jgi:hypothetical protein
MSALKLSALKPRPVPNEPSPTARIEAALERISGSDLPETVTWDLDEIARAVADQRRFDRQLDEKLDHVRRALAEMQFAIDTAYE